VEPASLAGASGWLQTNQGYTLWRTFNAGSTTATVRITGQMVGKSLVLTFTYDQPRVTAFDAGTWGPVVWRRQIVGPYYPGAVHYLPQESLFVTALLDWTGSAATSYSGTKGSYDTLSARAKTNSDLFSAGECNSTRAELGA
jgi:hypothetical protein